jgi:hypothetical protein
MVYSRPKRDWARERPKSRELVTLERLRQEMVKASAREWLNVLDRPTDDFISAAIPQALYDTLGDFDRGAARVAAQAFLDDNPPSEDQGGPQTMTLPPRS